MERQLSTLSHVVAAISALSYAWLVSQTTYVVTAAQFVTPLLIIVLNHTGYLAFAGGLRVGFAQEVFGRSASTALGMVAIFLIGSLAAPSPAEASSAAIETFLIVIFCLVVLLFVVAVAALILVALFRLVRGLWRMVRKVDDGPETRLFDFASLGIAAAILAASSLEDIPEFYSFDGENEVTATRFINADHHRVWTAMERATSPEFPLPNVLGAFPQPVSVSDQGIELGANRQVRFQGREGTGLLSLKVVSRTENKVMFAVIEDSSPYANWIDFQALSYRTTPENGRTRLEVSLGSERRLAPSWFFTPMMNVAARLAMDVLARDVKTRAEGV
ncbi:MAG: hypothetical protein AAF667_19820 [Pseudomonadota bacterium]